MASVKTVYETLKDLTNKDQQGFVTVSMFNNFANLAQLKIYNRLFGQLKDAQRNLKAGFDRGRDKGLVKRVEEDLAVFAKRSDVPKDATSGKFLREDSNIADLSRIISITTAGDSLFSPSIRTPVEICYDEEKIERILISNISAPTSQFPVALISEDIEVFPSSIQRIRVRYYKTPTAPVLAVTTTAGVETIDEGNSTDFDLPDHYEDELIVEIAEMAGLNLRDGFVQQYAAGEQAQKQREQSF